jgi:Leucine-rich repeat (LRR) protein
MNSMTRRPGRVGITTQLVLGTAVAALVGLLIYTVYPFSPEERAISELRRAIPKARIIWDDNRELGILFNQSGVTDEDLRLLRGLPIKRLRFIKEPLTDRGLEYLAGFADLSDLSLIGVPITDAGVHSISKFVGLQSLAVVMTDITDDGIPALAALSRLQELYLWRTRVSGKSLEYLASLAGLRKLDLGNSPVADDGLRSIGELTSLRELRLEDTRITDAGLEYLYGLTSLERLDINHTAVTKRGLTRLRSHLPYLAASHEANRDDGSGGSGSGRPDKH